VPGRPVGSGEVVTDGQGVMVGPAQYLLGVGDQVLTVLDGLGEVIAEFVQVSDRR
jgi:hypothetical protein